MRKIFSLLTAILFAGSMMADSFAPKALADITADDVVIVTMTNANGTYALANDKGTTNPPTAVPVTVTDGKISTDTTTILWQVVKDGDSFMLKAGESNLYCTNTNNGVRVGTSNGVFTISNDYLCCTSTSSNRYLGVYSSQDWRCYTTINSNISGQTLAFYVKEGAAPTTKYYMKNNWNLGAWAWKEMTKDGDNYKLENVVFGGTGVNYNTSESDQGATWVPVADIACDNLAAKDTVNFVLNPAAGTVTATIVGKYVEPIDPQTKDIQVVPGAWADYKLAAWAWEGSSAGAWYPVVAKNEQMIAEVPAAADHIIIVAFETTVETFDWNDKIAQTSNQDIDACGVIYINNGTPTWCQPAEIVAEDYTVAGNNTTLFGTSWDPTNTANDMALQEDGTYKWEKTEVTLADGNIEFKVVKDHDWNGGLNAYPADNYILNIAEDGEYTVTIIFNPAALEDKITANAQKTGEAVVEKHYLVVGQPMIANGEDWNNDADVNLMTTDDGGLTYTLVVTGAQLIANEEIDYRYKIVEKGSWVEYFPNTGDDAHLFVNQDGVYTLTYQYTVATQECVVMAQRTADLPEPTLTNGYYIIGKFAGVEDWTVAGLTEAHRFILQNETEEGAFYQLTNVPLAVGDSFKVVQVYHDLIVRTWPEGSTEGAVIDANHAGEAKTIYLSFLTTGQWYCNVEPNIYDGYYLVGNIGGVETWTPVAANRFSVTEEEGEFLLHYTLAENDRIKVGYAHNGVITSWYPDGTGNEYTVDANHAGEKDIYFRPIYRTEWEEFGGHIWMGANAVSPIDHVAFATGNEWTPDNESSAVWDPETGKITVTLALPKVDAWQGQVFVNTVKPEPGKCYNFSVKMKANKNMGGVTIKWQENNNDPIMVSEINTISLVANTEFVYTKNQIAGLDGNGMIIYDFGYAEAGTVVEIYDLVIEETDCPEPTYYLVGSMNDWNPNGDEQYLFTVNPDNEGELMLNCTLTENDIFKVVETVSNSWFPGEGGEASNYVVDAAHAGDVTIYFRPDYQGGEGWHYGCIYVDVHTGTAISNTAVDAKAEKIMRNGMILIIKGDKTYNVMGQRVK